MCTFKIICIGPATCSQFLSCLSYVIQCCQYSLRFHNSLEQSTEIVVKIIVFWACLLNNHEMFSSINWYIFVTNGRQEPQTKEASFSLLIWLSFVEGKKKWVHSKIIYLIVEWYPKYQVSTLTAKGEILPCIVVLREDTKYLFRALIIHTKNQYRLFHVICYIARSGIYLISIFSYGYYIYNFL